MAKATGSGTAFLAIAMIVMNLGTYGFQIAGARLLGPEEYGGVASLMALLLVVGVFQLGLQAVAARRVSANPEHVGQIERTMLVVTNRVAIAIGVLTLVLSPVVWKLLRLDNLWSAVLLAIAAVPMTIMGGQAGVLQGERRWLPLAYVYLANGIPRLVIGAVCMKVHPTETSAMLGACIAQFAPVLVGAFLLRRKRASTDQTEHTVRAISTETLHSSVALLAFFVLSNTDIVIARNVFTHHNAGLYAGGLILTKAAMFLPQFITTIAFPALANANDRRRALTRGVGAVAALGAVATLATWVLSGIALIFVGGHNYRGIESRLWEFAVIGTLLALLQLLVYSDLAQQGRRQTYLVWAGVVLIIVVGITLSVPTHLLALVIGVDAVLTAILLALALRQDTAPSGLQPAS